MSIDLDIRRELESLVSPDTSPETVPDRLRQLRNLGATRDEVESALETLRAEAPDEATEDRILEVLDFVVGFCRAENAVW